MDRQKPIGFSGDQPLTNPEDDQLNRNRFCEELARSLAAWKGRESLVFGITGEWGTGKSTIKNFIVHYLNGDAHVLEFNPWQWSGQDKLLEGFLWQLGAVFGREDVAKKSRKLAAKWKAFASITKLGGVSKVGNKLLTTLLGVTALSALFSAAASTPVVRWTIFVISAIFLFLSLLAAIAEKYSVVLTDWATFREQPLDELRAAIGRDLKKLDKPIIVFIDDLDRLTKEEIKLLIQLVKANCQFPNLVYVLLFQKDIVVRALSEITSDDGSRYLRKIIQVEVDVPTVSDNQMRDILLTRGLDPIINREGVTIRWDPQHWQSIFLDDLWPYFKTLRDIKRFLSSFEFYFTLHVNKSVLEVNPVDLIALEAIRVFDNEVFLAVSRGFFQRGLDRSLIFLEKDARQGWLDAIKEIVDVPSKSSSDEERLTHLRKSLFPQSTGSGDDNAWKRDLRVCDESSFYKYFQVSLDSGRPTAQEIAQFLAVSGERQALVRSLRLAIQQGTIEEFLDFVFVARDDIPIQNMVSVTTALFDIGDDLPEPKPSMFSTRLGMQCHRIIYHRLKSQTQEASTNVLWEAFNDTTGFILPIEHLSMEDKLTRERGEKTEFLISEDKLDQFLSLVLDRIRNKARDWSLLDHKDCGLVLYRWKNWTEGDEVGTWLKSAVGDPEKAIKVLRHLVSTVTINGVEKEPVLQGESVEGLIDLSLLKEAVSKFPSERLAPGDVINISLLCKAVDRKMQGKPYGEVRPDNSEL